MEWNSLFLEITLVVCVLAGASVCEQDLKCSMQVMKCARNPEYDKAIISGNTTALCTETKKVLQCMDKKIEDLNCELTDMVEKVTDKARVIQKKKCFGCSTEKFSVCLSPELQRADEEKNIAELCRLYPEVISCTKSALKPCEAVPDMNEYVMNLEDKVKSFNCNICDEKRFQGCNSLELMKAKEEQNTTALCRLLPDTVSCLKSAIKPCEGVEGIDIDMMNEYVSKVEKDIDAKQCISSASVLTTLLSCLQMLIGAIVFALI